MAAIDDNYRVVAREFRAMSKGKASSRGDTPLQAARSFFEINPTARKVDVYENDVYASGSHGFTIGSGNYQKWTGLNKAAALALPDVPGIVPGSELAAAPVQGGASCSA